MKIFKHGLSFLPKKRSSLNLSVNAIVVLIMAITMLGLGLGFIKGMFGKISDKVESQIAAEPDAPTASANKPISISREAVVGRAGDPVALKFSIYCMQDACPAGEGGPTVAIDCDSVTVTPPTFDAMTLGQVQSGLALLTLGDTPGTEICKATATGLSGSTHKVDFALTIKQ